MNQNQQLIIYVHSTTAERTINFILLPNHNVTKPDENNHDESVV